MECFGGWEKGEPNEARAEGGARAGKDRAGQGRAGEGRGGRQGRAGGDLHLIKQKYNLKK